MRYTERDEFGEWCLKDEDSTLWKITRDGARRTTGDAIYRLTNLEDKIESGELVEVVHCKDCKYNFFS